MKWKYIICLGIGVLFVVMYVIGYKTAKGWESEVITYGYGAENVNVSNGVILKRDTEYILESYNSENAENETYEGMIPVAFIGLTREQLIDFLGENPEFFEEEGELVKNVMLVSFSENKIVIRKNIEEIEETTTYDFNIEENSPKYYIFLIDDTVKVYKEDKTTIYMETGITVDELDESVADELSMGVAVKNISELYRLLESFTT